MKSSNPSSIDRPVSPRVAAGAIIGFVLFIVVAATMISRARNAPTVIDPVQEAKMQAAEQPGDAPSGGTDATQETKDDATQSAD